MLSTYKTNVIGNVHVINLLLPLIRAGKVKKVISISSGHADYDLARDYKIMNSSSYTMSKAAMNLAIVKYHAEWSSQGILFMSISPGVVDTGHLDTAQREFLLSFHPIRIRYNPPMDLILTTS